MTSTLLSRSQLEELFAQDPAWLRDLREKALQAYQTLAYPTSRDEHWRRTDPERVRPGQGTVLAPEQSLEFRGAQALPAGVVFSPLGPQVESAQSLLWKIAGPSTAHAALNGAFWRGGTYLSVPKDTSTGEGYLESVHHFSEAGMAVPHSLLKVGRGSKAALLETFECGEHEVLGVPVVEIEIEEGACLTYVYVNRWGPEANAVPRIHARVGRDAHLQMLVMNLGTQCTKCFIETDLVGPGAKSEVLGLFLGQGRQHCDVDCQQNHRVGSTVSDVKYHVALTDRARSIFAGNILCEPGAQKIDGYQQNRNLLLSDKARADSMPRLEIEANDVRCTHGASFTTYDEAQRFYLQTRGLTGFEAQLLLVTGFFASVVERLEHPALVEWIRAQLDEKMESALRR